MNGTDTASPFSLQATTVGFGRTPIEGFHNVVEYRTPSNGPAWGAITFPADPRVAGTALRCFNNTLQALVKPGSSEAMWRKLQIANYPWDAELMFTDDPYLNGVELKPYAVSINGVKQSGIFLGATHPGAWDGPHVSDHAVKWGFSYYPVIQSCCGRAFYSPRLLEPYSGHPVTGKPMQDGEFESFLKVVE